MAMKPRVARFCARAQVCMAIGILPLAVIAFIAGIPFGWEKAGFACLSTLVSGAGVSAVGIPAFGLIVSWAWPGSLAD